MDEILSRFVGDLAGRLTGPLTLRLFLQPAVAIFYAVRDGIKDGRAGRKPYFWSLFTEPKPVRRRRIAEGWRAVMKVFLMAIAIDLIYQLIVFKWIYPIEALVTAVILAILPYVLLRGPIARLLE